MEDLNIPIYRAKKIDSDEYVEGFLSPNDKESKQWCIGTINEWKVFKIDPSTLAIHFPDKDFDIDGKPFFRSLRKDGKGGDLRQTHHAGMNKWQPTERKYLSSTTLRADISGKFRVIEIQE